jgi:Tol biopolymer transport system component
VASMAGEDTSALLLALVHPRVLCSTDTEMEGMMRRTVLGIATMMVAGVAACGVVMLAEKEPVQAAYPGQNDRIAYVSHAPSGLHEIYTMNPNGTDRKMLTNNQAYDTSPAYSPNGKEIAFVSQREGQESGKVYTMNAKDGTGQRNLSGSTDGIDPAYSPNGERIAFVGQGENEDILVMSAKDGSAQKNLTNTPPVNGYEVRERDPAYSPDGTWIVFYKETFRPHDVDLYKMNANRTGAKPAIEQITDYPGKEYSPDWSPNGQKIVFYQDTRTKGLRIFTIRPDGTDRQLIVQDGKDPVFSPDGRKIAFTRDGNVYTVNADGTGERQVPGTPPENGPSEVLPNWGPKSP